MPYEINFFKNTFDTDCSNITTIEETLSRIKSDEFKDQILNVRQAKKENNAYQMKKWKADLPAVTWSGKFFERKDGSCLVYNHIFVVDIDNIGINRLKRFKKELIDNPWVYAYFDGPTKGIKILVFVDSPIEWHSTHAFDTIDNAFYNLYNIRIDRSGRNISRLCYVSYDPSLYINEDALALHIEPAEKVKMYDHIKHKNPFNTESAIKDGLFIFNECVKITEFSRVGKYRKGNRNNFIFVLSCLLCEHAITREQAESYICSRFKSLEVKEVQTTVSSAYRRAKFATKTIEDFRDRKQKPLI